MEYIVEYNGAGKVDWKPWEDLEPTRTKKAALLACKELAKKWPLWVFRVVTNSL